jgi:hypothetical protein
MVNILGDAPGVVLGQRGGHPCFSLCSTRDSKRSRFMRTTTTVLKGLGLSCLSVGLQVGGVDLAGSPRAGQK